MAVNGVMSDYAQKAEERQPKHVQEQVDDACNSQKTHTIPSNNDIVNAISKGRT